MTAKQQWTIVAVVVAAMAGGLATASHFLRDELRPISVGSTAPDFSAVTVDGSSTIKTLDSYKGEVVLLNVWATSCIPCRVEMPSMEALYRDYAPKGLKIVAVSLDNPGMTQGILDFVKEYDLTFEILYDTTGSMQKNYRTTGYPESFVISRDGTIHKKIYGQDDWNSAANRTLFDQLLAEPR